MRCCLDLYWMENVTSHCWTRPPLRVNQHHTLLACSSSFSGGIFSMISSLLTCRKISLCVFFCCWGGVISIIWTLEGKHPQVMSMSLKHPITLFKEVTRGVYLWNRYFSDMRSLMLSRESTLSGSLLTIQELFRLWKLDHLAALCYCSGLNLHLRDLTECKQPLRPLVIPKRSMCRGRLQHIWPYVFSVANASRGVPDRDVTNTLSTQDVAVAWVTVQHSFKKHSKKLCGWTSCKTLFK